MLNAEVNMQMALLGEAPISSQTAAKRAFPSLRSLAEMDSAAAAKAAATSYHIVVLCLTLHARCCHISAMQIVDVIKSTHCEKLAGF